MTSGERVSLQECSHFITLSDGRELIFVAMYGTFDCSSERRFFGNVLVECSANVD